MPTDENRSRVVCFEFKLRTGSLMNTMPPSFDFAVDLIYVGHET